MIKVHEKESCLPPQCDPARRAFYDTENPEKFPIIIKKRKCSGYQCYFPLYFRFLYGISCFRPSQSTDRLYFRILSENYETGTVPLWVARSYLLYRRTVRKAASPGIVTVSVLPALSHF